AEGVGGDAVHPGFEVVVVDRADNIGPGDVEDFVASLVAVEIAEGCRAGLEHSAYRLVGYYYALRQGGAERSRLPPDPLVRVAGLAVVPRHRVPSLDARPVSRRASTGALGGLVPRGQWLRCYVVPDRQDNQ